MTSEKNKISKFEEKIGISFKNEKLLREALTHRSYLNENPSWDVQNNERLEFLGDSVLELSTTEYLFNLYPNKQEGELTSLRAALVNYQMLSKVAREIDLENFIFLSKGESKDTGRARDVILANAVEALIGALYLDQGYEIANNFIEKFICIHLNEIVEQELFRDPKSFLQEIIQEERKITPTYRVLREIGPDHEKEFFVGVFFGDEYVAEGRGKSKQEAESNAAKEALLFLKRK